LVRYAVDPTVVPEATTDHYIINASGSTFRVKATATGMLSSLGHSPTIAIPAFEGDIFVDSEAIEKSSLRIVIRSEALTVTDDMSEKDRQEINRRMQQEVLESDSYSEIIYECNKVSASKSGEGQYWAALNGDLTMHGVQRTQVVSARISVNGSTLRAMGDFSILQSVYDIRPVSALGGAIRLKDELKFSFDISARKRE
jgi:polyisoprenoid-binding protein YceI